MLWCGSGGYFEAETTRRGVFSWWNATSVLDWRWRQWSNTLTGKAGRRYEKSERATCRANVVRPGMCQRWCRADQTGRSAKPSNCPLDIYASESDVKRPFETVALLTSRTGTSLFERHTIDAAIEYAKSKACECGADAIVVMQASSGSGWSAPYGKANATMKAIRYLAVPAQRKSFRDPNSNREFFIRTKRASPANARWSVDRSPLPVFVPLLVAHKRCSLYRESHEVADHGFQRRANMASRSKRGEAGSVRAWGYLPTTATSGSRWRRAVTSSLNSCLNVPIAVPGGMNVATISTPLRLTFHREGEFILFLCCPCPGKATGGRDDPGRCVRILYKPIDGG